MIITLKDIKKIVGGSILFEELSFELNEYEKVGLVGRNGSGKSTLFKLITAEELIDSGDVFIRKGTTIGYLQQIPEEWQGSGRQFLESSFDYLLDIADEMKALEAQMQKAEDMDRALERYGRLQEEFARRGGYEMEATINKVATGLGVEMLLDQTFTQLSGGEQTKIGLAKLLITAPDVLLLDEPTNHLDLLAIEWLESYLNQYDGAVCIVSHDREFLDQTVQAIADLEAGEITRYSGNYSAFERQKEEKLLAEFHQYQEQQKKIKKMKEAIRRLRQWANEANPPNPKLFKKAKSMEKALERMEKKEKPLIDPKKMNLSLTADGRSGTDVFRIANVRKSFEGREILKGVDLHLRYKDRLAIVGANGSGKSTLIKLLLGLDEADSGVIQGGSSLKIGYLPQHPLQDVPPDMRVIDYFRNEVIVTEGQARQILAKFMFYGYTVFNKVKQLSGGERMRLKLAVFMHQGINLLLLDEPTNHLDVDSQEVLEDALIEFSGTVLGVSHDRYFLNQCFSETAYLLDGRLHRYPGNYQETQQKWKELQSSKEEVCENSSNIRQMQREKVKDYEQLILLEEANLEKVEQRILENHKQQEGDSLNKQKERLEAKITVLYEQWMNV
ncbi:ABC transporter ATP-binding protein [Thalassobacillus devorans]|uniref:ABC transporter ATP-binding protein n=1 Tax=Thalassobacillus devorans TaxID=279813 RepID=A0ABQ1PWY7_9BACI|nr:ABC-F family ATP-binding cassette domain-containing protein [Thalassobacillus devorans]NIK30897.1 ATPase subunit of ABC transporter with duplicated ATPase domains [Thalassobacillus devorans]GGD05101.1 ABC transporter ATP-binding protein [Thalassobacillus devorans]